MPKEGAKSWIAIGYDATWKPVYAYYVIEEEFSELWCVSVGGGGYEVCHFSESVYDDKDCVMIM